MNKIIINKIGQVGSKIRFKFNYLMANTIMRKKIDSGNNYFNIMNDTELVDKIVFEKKSFSRFGDGELSLILNKNFFISYQDNSEDLNNRLREVLESKLDNMILGINLSFNDPSSYNRNVQRYCRTFNYLYREKYKKIIPNDNIYGNSSITRFYIDYENKDIQGAKKRIENIKRIWSNQNVLIVEGIHTRLGVGNDLFDNSKNIRRILIPETNAFNKYDEILKCIIKNVNKDEMVLLAAGPTATILVYDLSKKNIQSIDVGHVDIEYEWMKLGVKKRTAIKGKYVNEIKGKKYNDVAILDKKYEKQIICRIN